ncbi:2OG-Fe(II) oxygenase family protein [Pseudoalteromonas ulvae]|uniref:2OG-Fe(II) oxygenase family protein n=1 Tax=Pseudoalteromonas ulvae TaxID=107327 RepID=UPI00186B651D|nr:2OG-Fe(II) oxygenase [Pseudoalteromonas ulvae]
MNTKQCQAFIDLFNEDKSQVEINNKAAGNYSGETQYRDYLLNLSGAPELEQFIKEMMLNAMEEYKQLLDLPFSLGEVYEPFEIMKFKRSIDKFEVHFDSNGKAHPRSLAIIWYLNDVEEGGVLHMPSKLQPLTVKPKKGRMVIMPTDWTHYHYVTPATSGDRYSLITFINHT